MTVSVGVRQLAYYIFTKAISITVLYKLIYFEEINEMPTVLLISSCRNLSYKFKSPIFSLQIKRWHKLCANV